MLPAIATLASDVSTAWMRAGHAEADFCDVAATNLARPLDLDFASLACYVCEGAELPDQRRLDQEFGQPAITLYRDDRFTIEALCWHSGTPAIHDHAFSGAFKVLTGRSVHSRYAFEEHEWLGRVALGNLRLERIEVLDQGACVRIPRGSAFIHANFHLDSPTMTLVVRTHQVAEPENVYLPPGVAFDPSDRGPSLHKRLQLLDTLHQTGHESFMSCVEAAIDNSDAYDGLAIVMRLASRVDTPTFMGLAGRLHDRYGSKGERFVAGLVEERRRSSILRLRSKATSPDARYFMASLLSFSCRQDLLQAMTEHYKDPAVARERTTAGVAEVLGGERDQQLITAVAAEAMLDDVPVPSFPERAAARWQRTFSQEESRKLEGYYQQILDHPMLVPLRHMQGHAAV